MSRITDWKPARPVPTALVVSTLGLAMFLLRRPSFATRPGLYAEDGTRFFLDALQIGGPALLDPHNGYLTLLTRLIAAAAAAFPLAWTPWVIAVLTALVSVASCAIVLSDRFSTLIPSYAARVLLFALLLLTPRIGEVHLTANSVFWWGGIALFLTSLGDDPRSESGRALELAAVPLLALSGLVGLVLAPLPALRWQRTRSAHSIGVLAAWWVASIVQVAVYLSTVRHNSTLVVGPTLLRSAIEKVFGSTLLGGATASIPPILLVVIAIAALAWLVVVVSGSPWTTSVAVIWTGVVPVAAGFVAVGHLAPRLAARYTLIPIAAVITGVICSRPSPKVLSALRIGLLVVIVAMRVTDFEVPAFPATDWQRSAECLEDRSRECTVKLNPPGWKVTVPPGAR